MSRMHSHEQNSWRALACAEAPAPRLRVLPVKKVRRKWVLLRLIQCDDSFYYVREDFHGAMRLIMMRWTAYTYCLTSEFDRLGPIMMGLWIWARVQRSTVSDTSMKCTIIWAAGGYIVLKGGASLMHQIWIWYEPVTSSYLTSYGNLYPSVKRFGLCDADFGVCTEPTEPKWFADWRPDRRRGICTAPAVLIYQSHLPDGNALITPRYVWYIVRRNYCITDRIGECVNDVFFLDTPTPWPREHVWCAFYRGCSCSSVSLSFPPYAVEAEHSLVSWRAS